MSVLINHKLQQRSLFLKNGCIPAAIRLNFGAMQVYLKLVGQGVTHRLMGRIALLLFMLLATTDIWAQRSPLNIPQSAKEQVKKPKPKIPLSKRIIGRPSLRFHERHARIGEPIYVSLAIKHAPELDLVFPDSLYDYGTFEFLGKSFYPTRSNGQHAVDSVVYTLQTFQMKPEQGLQLAILDYTDGDTITYTSNKDTLYLHRMIPELPSKPLLKLKVEPETIPQWINYNYWALGLGLTLFVLLLVNTFLGKPLQKGVSLLIEYRRHIVFTTIFDRLASQTLRNRSTDTMEQALTLWKQYMERIDNQPFTTFTTKEITAYLEDEHLNEALRSIDRAVYGGMKDEISERIFTILRRYALTFYGKKKDEIRGNNKKAIKV